MKYLFFVIFLCFGVCGAQTNSVKAGIDTPLEKYINSFNPDETVIREDKLNEELKNFLELEYDSITDKIKEHSILRYRIPADTLKFLFSKENMEQYRSILKIQNEWSEKCFSAFILINKGASSNYFKKEILALSQPVYTKNEMFAFFLSSGFNGYYQVGFNELIIYVKKNGKWTKWKAIELSLI